MDWLDFCWIDLNTKKSSNLSKVFTSSSCRKGLQLPKKLHPPPVHSLSPSLRTHFTDKRSGPIDFKPRFHIGSFSENKHFAISSCASENRVQNTTWHAKLFHRLLWCILNQVWHQTFLKCMILPLLWEKTSIAESIAISSISGCTMKPILKIYMWEARNGARMET